MRLLAAFSLVCITVAAACAARPAADPAPDPVSLNATCEGCHADAAATWRGSLHARAFTDALFQESLAREPSPFCRDCHAPIATAPALGVTCTTCHGAAPHEPGARTSEAACGTCHEFPFPDNARRASPALMQRTLTEHRGSRFADRSCQSCHMPKRDGGRSHAFAVASDPALLQRALVAHAERTDRGIAFDLAPGEVGHALPTGDLFRRLVVIADSEGEDHRLLGHASRALARHFRFDEAKVQQEIADDRVQGPQRIELPLTGSRNAEVITWRIEWQRVSAMHEDEADVAERVVIAQGAIYR